MVTSPRSNLVKVTADEVASDLLWTESSGWAELAGLSMLVWAVFKSICIKVEDKPVTSKDRKR